MAARRLVSWKEVAGYLQCTIRSVQRWERSEGLPVHRHFHGRGSTVYAFSRELDFWLGKRTPLEASHATSSRSSTAPARLFVQPFVKLANDPQMILLCDGLTEGIIFQLTSLKPENLGVIARTISMRQKTLPKTISEMGRGFGMTSVMERCVRPSRSHIRITVQLILVSDQTQVWTGCFDGEGSDPVRFELEIAKQIVHALRERGILTKADQSRPVAEAPPPHTIKHFQPGHSEIDEFQIGHSKPDSQGSTGTRQELVGKGIFLSFMIFLRARKGLWIQEPGRNNPC